MYLISLKFRSKVKRKNQELRSESISSNAEPVSEMNKIPAKKKYYGEKYIIYSFSKYAFYYRIKAHVHATAENNYIDPQHAQPIVVLTPLNHIYQSGSEHSTPTSSITTYVLFSINSDCV